MIVLDGDDVNQLYVQGLDMLIRYGRRQSSRNGPVIVMDQPITSVYREPTQRVLFNAARDANPFFHLMEAIWMLAGRDDAAFLTRYAKQLGEYAEADGHIHGAYGNRWRWQFGFDQLAVVVERLRKNPDDRQAVLAMWDPSEFDMGARDLTDDLKDRPCNTHVYLRVQNYELDITVCCRSNDAIWGCYGANAVHFSVLQEYLAAAIGVDVGTYYQISNNFHVYDNDLFRRCTVNEAHRDGTSHLYAKTKWAPVPMVTVPDAFLTDCEQFCRAVDLLWKKPPVTVDGELVLFVPVNKWFVNVPWQMALAHWHYKHGDNEGALRSLGHVAAPDWRKAATDWVYRRIMK